jgi:hypothetical protein
MKDLLTLSDEDLSALLERRKAALASMADSERVLSDVELTEAVQARVKASEAIDEVTGEIATRHARAMALLDAEDEARRRNGDLEREAQKREERQQRSAEYREASAA